MYKINGPYYCGRQIYNYFPNAIQYNLFVREKTIKYFKAIQNTIIFMFLIKYPHLRES